MLNIPTADGSRNMRPNIQAAVNSSGSFIEFDQEKTAIIAALYVTAYFPYFSRFSELQWRFDSDNPKSTRSFRPFGATETACLTTCLASTEGKSDLLLGVRVLRDDQIERFTLQVINTGRDTELLGAVITESIRRAKNPESGITSAAHHVTFYRNETESGTTVYAVRTTNGNTLVAKTQFSHDFPSVYFATPHATHKYFSTIHASFRNWSAKKDLSLEPKNNKGEIRWEQIGIRDLPPSCTGDFPYDQLATQTFVPGKFADMLDLRPN